MRRKYWPLAFIFPWILLASFYFWGSAAVHPSNEYHGIESFMPQETDSFRTLSVVTYNLGYLSGKTNNTGAKRSKELFDSHYEQLVKYFQNNPTDILATQEIDFQSNRSFYVNQFKSIGNSLNYVQGAKSVNWDRRYVPFPYFPISEQFGQVLSGQAIFSKFSMSNLDVHILKRPKSNPFYYDAFYLDRLLQVVLIDIDSTTIALMNVHLEAWDIPTREAQALYVRNILDKYERDYPVILVGDFNSVPPSMDSDIQTDRVLEYILTHPNIQLSIPITPANVVDPNLYTFNTWDPNKRIDYIFYTPNSLELVNSRVLNDIGEISDHFPVRASFRVK